MPSGQSKARSSSPKLGGQPSSSGSPEANPLVPDWGSMSGFAIPRALETFPLFHGGGHGPEGRAWRERGRQGGAWRGRWCGTEEASFASGKISPARQKSLIPNSGSDSQRNHCKHPVLSPMLLSTLLTLRTAYIVNRIRLWPDSGCSGDEDHPVRTQAFWLNEES